MSFPTCRKPIRPILKKPSSAPVCFRNAENVATSSTLTRTSISCKSALVSRPLERSQTVTPRKTLNAAGSSAACEVPCKPAPCSKMENICRRAEVTHKALVAPLIKTTSVATVKPRLKQKNIDDSKMGHAKESLGENTTVALNLHGINLPSAPHLTTAVPELKKPHKEPSHKSTSKMAPSKNPSKVGLNQLIIMSCEGKRQVYCLLCSARLRSSSHTTSYNHCYNYVKMKYPGWTAKLSEKEKKLKNIVAHLAKVERNVGFQSPRRVEVTRDTYQKLAALAEDAAVEMVKTMLRQKDPHVSSLKAETVEALREEAASPCQVSSSDGLSVVDNKVSGFLSDQTQQEHKTLDQTQQIQFTGENNLVEHQSVKSSEDKSDVQEQPHMSICDKVHPDPAPGSQAEEIKENVQEDRIEPDAEVYPMSEITHGNESSGTKLLKSLCKTEDRHTPVRICDAASPLPPKALESPLKRSLIPICSPPLQTLASLTTGPQNSSGSSYITEHDAGLGEYSTSQAQPLKLFGAKAPGCSRLLFSLNVSQSLKSVIGMDLVWECRGISQETFYLCESCEEKLSYQDICQHMVSLQHQLRYLWRSHPQFLQMFWLMEDLPPELKLDILNDIVQELVPRERFHKLDARCILLGQELYWFVRMTHFSEALKVVKIITNKENQMALFLRISAIQQNGQQNDCLSVEEPHPTKSLLASTLNTKHRSDFEAGQNVTKTDNLVKKKISVEEDSHIVKKRGILSPDGRSSVKKDLVASLIPVHPNPHKTSRASFPKPKPTTNPSHLQSSDPPPKVKLIELTSTTISPAVTQNLISLTNESPRIRKRAAETSPETLLQSCTSGPLEHPLPAKCTPSPVTKSEPKPSSASGNSAENSTPLPLKGNTSGPKQIPPTVDRTVFAELVSELNMNSNVKDFSSKSASDHSVTSNSCADISHGNIKTRWDSRIVVIKSPTAVLKKRWDSKCQLVKATVKKKLSLNSADGIKTELLTTDVSSAVSASISCEQLLNGSYSAYSSATTVVFASATADPKDPHALRSSSAQDVFWKCEQLLPIVVHEPTKTQDRCQRVAPSQTDQGLISSPLAPSQPPDQTPLSSPSRAAITM